MFANLTRQHMIYIAVAFFVVILIVVMASGKKKESFQDNLSENITIKY